jgi:hypothetical protein
VQVMKDIAPGVVEELVAEFRYFQRKKPNSHLEPKVMQSMVERLYD